MSLSPFDSFQSRFVTYLLNFTRNLLDFIHWRHYSRIEWRHLYLARFYPLASL